MEREQYIQILKSGKVTDTLTVIYDFRSGGYVLIDSDNSAESRVEYISIQSAKAYVSKYTDVIVKDTDLQYLPKYRTTYDPKQPFGALTDIDFNVHHEPIPEDGIEGRVHPDFGSLFKNLFEDKEGVEYALYWLGNLVQGNKNETAIIVHGEEGTGKGTLYKLIEAMIGSTNVLVAGNKSLIGNHNEEFIYKRLLAFNEVESFSSNGLVQALLKELVTDPTMLINPKNRTAFKAPNFANIMLSSNRDNFIKLPFSDRRYSVFNQKSVLNHNDPDLSNRINKLINSDEIFRLKEFLLNLDLSKWDSRTPFQNETRRRMMMTTATEKEYLINLIKDEQGRNTKDLFLDDLFMGAESDLDYSFTENSDSYRKAIEGTDYSKEKIKVAETMMKRDYDLLYSKGILTSRYGVLLYRIVITQGKFSTTAIGRFYSGFFGKSKTINISGKRLKGYKINR